MTLTYFSLPSSSHVSGEHSKKSWAYFEMQSFVVMEGRQQASASKNIILELGLIG